MRALLLTFATALLETTAHAQTADLPPTLDCIEIAHAQADQELTAYSNEKGKFALTFARKINGDYTMVGNLGTADLVTIRRDGFVQLLEQTPIGTMNVTTILTEATRGRFTAVHSRHSIILGELAPSQYIMSCSAR